MEKNLEKLRDQLNSMVDSTEFTTEEILAISQKLDKLIVSYYQNNDKLASSTLTQE